MPLFNRNNYLIDDASEHKKELRKEQNKRYYEKHKALVEVQKISSTLQKIKRLQEAPVKPKIPEFEGF